MAKLGYWITGPCFTFPPSNWFSVCALWQYCKLSVIKLTQNIHTEWGLILIFLKCFEILRWRAGTIPGKHQAFSILKNKQRNRQDVLHTESIAIGISGFAYETFSFQGQMFSIGNTREVPLTRCTRDEVDKVHNPVWGHMYLALTERAKYLCFQCFQGQCFYIFSS